MTMTPEQRAMRARVASLARWAKEDPRPQMQNARDKFNERFEREVDPENTLSYPERQRRAAAARKAYFTRLGLASSRARSKKNRG